MNLSFGLVKTAADEQADALLAREARWLRELERVQELEGQVPRVLQEGTSPAGRRYLVISMWPGHGETRAFTSDHARFLASLRKARFRAVDFEVSGSCQWMQRSLEESYQDCETARLYWTGPYVLSQGDFVPWNIRNLGVVARAGDRRADPRLPVRRGAAPLARQAPHRARRRRGRRVLEAAREKSGMDAEMNPGGTP